MLTLGKIQLRGFFTFHPEAVENFLNTLNADEKDGQWSMRQVLLMYDAYLTLTGFRPETMCSDDFAGFRGFLYTALELSEEAAKDIISDLFWILIGAKAFTEEQASLVLGEPQPRCNEKYLECEPSQAQLLSYQSLFPTMEPGGVVYVGFASIASMLKSSSLNSLSGLLSQYFASLTTKQAETDAPLIIALAQGLLHQHPGVDFGNIRLTATKSTDFIAGARTTAEWQMHNAGYLREDTAENWKYVSAVILNFYVANNIFRLNKTGRRLLAPY